MNKPKGVVSSTDDPTNRTILDLIDGEYLVFNPFPAGRLDKDTEGLLLLTNDGKLAHEILSPNRKIDKTYYVEVEGFIEEKHKDKFYEGITLDDGYKTLPSKLDIIESNLFSKARLTIREGKYHQVKRMFESLNMKVVYLKRLSMGSLKLDENLGLGKYRELTEEEIQLLKEKK
jgi:16S rRNA pseudouridine516 synthase